MEKYLLFNTFQILAAESVIGTQNMRKSVIIHKLEADGGAWGFKVEELGV